MIEPRQLFSKEILEYEVSSRFCGARAYINLDHAATTPPFIAVEQAVNNFMQSYGSVHRGAGNKSKISTNIYEKSRQQIKDFVNAPKDSYLIQTGNTTGAMNTIAHFMSFLEGQIAVSSIEHSSSFLPWVVAEGRKAIGARQVRSSELGMLNDQIQDFGLDEVLRYDLNEEGKFDEDSIEKVLKHNRVKALVLTASSNLTGYCPDIKKIGKLVHKYGAYFIVDACQYIQHHALDMQELQIDFLVASGHKFYAPYGGGFLIGPKDFLDHFLPYQIGGGNLPYIDMNGRFLRYQNELAHDAGTPNAVGMISMAVALTELAKIGLSNVNAYETGLTVKAYRALEENPNIELHVKANHLTTILSFSIKGMNHHKVAERLNADYGIGVRAGSFCVYSAVRNLLSIDDDKEIVAGVKAGDTSKVPGIVRASFSICNTERDVDDFISAINEITCSRVSSFSPVPVDTRFGRKVVGG